MCVRLGNVPAAVRCAERGGVCREEGRQTFPPEIPQLDGPGRSRKLEERRTRRRRPCGLGRCGRTLVVAAAPGAGPSVSAVNGKMDGEGSRVTRVRWNDRTQSNKILPPLTCLGNKQHACGLPVGCVAQAACSATACNATVGHAPVRLGEVSFWWGCEAGRLCQSRPSSREAGIYYHHHHHPPATPGQHQPEIYSEICCVPLTLVGCSPESERRAGNERGEEEGVEEGKAVRSVRQLHGPCVAGTGTCLN